MSNETTIAAIIASLTGLAASAGSFVFGRGRRHIEERTAAIQADGAAVDVVAQALEALRNMGAQLNDALATIDQLRQDVRRTEAEAKRATDDARVAAQATTRCQADRDVDRAQFTAALAERDAQIAALSRRMVTVEDKTGCTKGEG